MTFCNFLLRNALVPKPRRSAAHLRGQWFDPASWQVEESQMQVWGISSGGTPDSLSTVNDHMSE